MKEAEGTSAHHLGHPLCWMWMTPQAVTPYPFEAERDLLKVGLEVALLLKIPQGKIGNP